jgi:hypothetical protein
MPSINLMPYMEIFNSCGISGAQESCTVLTDNDKLTYVFVESESSSRVTGELKFSMETVQNYSNMRIDSVYINHFGTANGEIVYGGAFCRFFNTNLQYTAVSLMALNSNVLLYGESKILNLSPKGLPWTWEDINDLNVELTLNVENGIAYIATMNMTINYSIIESVIPNLKCRIDGSIKSYADGWVRVDGTLRKINSMWTRVDGVLKKI